MTYKVAKAISKYWFKFLVPIGLIGNTLSFLVMMKPSNRKMSTCIYMASISVNDNLMILLALYTHLSNDLGIIDSGKSFVCKFVAYIVLTCLQNSTYQVLAMTTDKFIAIKWPHKAATYSTPRRAKITLLCVHMFVIVYNLPHIFLTNKENKIFRVYLVASVFSSIHSWLSFVVNFIVPFSSLFFMNLVIIQQVRRSHQKFGKQTNSNEGQSDSRLRAQKNVENQLTRMLVLVTSLFLILLFPTYVRFVYTTIVGRDTPEKRAAGLLLYHISNKLYSTNSGINFFLYCISGQKFRSDLKELLCCSAHQREGIKRSESSGTTFTSVEDPSGSKSSVFTTAQKGVWNKGKSLVKKCVTMSQCVHRWCVDSAVFIARMVDVVYDWAVSSRSLFCWEQQDISCSVDCDILQDQLVLGSCIVGYVYKRNRLALSIRVSNVYDRKRLFGVITAQLMNMHQAVVKCKCPD